MVDSFSMEMVPIGTERDHLSAGMYSPLQCNVRNSLFSYCEYNHFFGCAGNNTESGNNSQINIANGSFGNNTIW